MAELSTVHPLIRFLELHRKHRIEEARRNASVCIMDVRACCV